MCPAFRLSRGVFQDIPDLIEQLPLFSPQGCLPELRCQTLDLFLSLHQRAATIAMRFVLAVILCLLAPAAGANPAPPEYEPQQGKDIEGIGPF